MPDRVGHGDLDGRLCVRRTTAGVGVDVEVAVVAVRFGRRRVDAGGDVDRDCVHPGVDGGDDFLGCPDGNRDDVPLQRERAGGRTVGVAGVRPDSARAEPRALEPRGVEQ
jgi:hypothetical protein